MSRFIQIGDFIVTSDIFIFQIDAINLHHDSLHISGLNIDGLGGSIIIKKDEKNWTSVVKNRHGEVLDRDRSIYFLDGDTHPWYYLLHPHLDFNKTTIRTDGLRPMIDISHDITRILDIRPGDHFKFLSFHIKFYDFADPYLFSEKD